EVALLGLDVVEARPGVPPLIVVVHRDGERLFRLVLPDDVLVQDLPDLLGLGNAAQVRVALLVELLLDDLVAQLDALVADVNAGTGDQLLDLLLHLAAEGALELALLIAELEHDASPSSLRSGVFPLLLSAAD